MGGLWAHCLPDAPPDQMHDAWVCLASDGRGCRRLASRFLRLEVSRHQTNDGSGSLPSAQNLDTRSLRFVSYESAAAGTCSPRLGCTPQLPHPWSSSTECPTDRAAQPAKRAGGGAPVVGRRRRGRAVPDGEGSCRDDVGDRGGIGSRDQGGAGDRTAAAPEERLRRARRQLERRSLRAGSAAAGAWNGSTDSIWSRAGCRWSRWELDGRVVCCCPRMKSVSTRQASRWGVHARHGEPIAHPSFFRRNEPAREDTNPVYLNKKMRKNLHNP